MLLPIAFLMPLPCATPILCLIALEDLNSTRVFVLINCFGDLMTRCLIVCWVVARLLLLAISHLNIAVFSLLVFFILF